MLPGELDFHAEARNAEKTRECFKNHSNIRVKFSQYPSVLN